MFTVECAFRLTPSGVVFRLDDDPPEAEMCELRAIRKCNGCGRPPAVNLERMTRP